METFTNLLNTFEDTFSGIMCQTTPINLRFTDLNKMNKIKKLMEEIKFLPELYDWNRLTRFITFLFFKNHFFCF